MNWYSVRGTVGLWFLLGAAACGSGTFSEDFAQEIQKDCLETQNCQKGNQIAECIHSTATATDKWSTNRQQFYVDTVVRCENKNGCDYVTCTTSDPTSGYAGTHLAQITWECQQRVGCKLASGQMTTPNEVQSCIDALGSSLNENPAAQVAFDGRSARCAAAMGCAYNTCN
jgi:hypothetical protein